MKKFLVLIIIFSSACSPGYVLKAAYVESKILLNREKISDVLESPEYSKEEKEKLKIVKEARDFAVNIGLKPEGSFTYYTKIDQKVLAWVLMAAKKDSFQYRTWWFPIVGSVPYKGYFKLSDAQDYAKSLEEDGYETYIRPTDAFSTLGWFDDPILTPALKNDIPTLVNLVIHESFHSTIWYKDDVIKNESFANYVGHKGAIDFFKRKYKTTLDPETQTHYVNSLKYFQREKFLAEHVEKLYQELDKLYKSELSKDAKLAKREQIFKDLTQEIHQKYPNLNLLKSLNNAEIMHLRLYLGKFDHNKV